MQASSDERVDALDAHLWTYNDSNFLPHGTARDSDAALQPILLTTADHNPNGANGAVPDRRRADAGRMPRATTGSC